MEFSGWSMPLWYPAGAIAEHRAVIASAGLFDTSHMSAVMINGQDAFDLLQRCFTKNLNSCVGKKNGPLAPGRCVYGAYLTRQGEVLDDAVVYQIAEQNYMTIVNAGMGSRVGEHLRAHSADLDADISDLTGKVGKMDIQGPMSAKVLMRVLEDPNNTLRDMPYFGFKGHFHGKSATSDTFINSAIPILLSRTGYTGEFGFEILVDPSQLLRVWEAILEAGQDFGVIPCGLAARDSLRAGAVLPLSHQDIGPWPFINHPWPFALPYNSDETAFTKRFVGDRVLELRKTAEYTHPFAGYDPRKVSVHDPAVVLDSNDNEIGVVLTCVADMAIGRVGNQIYSMASPGKPGVFKPSGLCCGFVRVKSRLLSGEEVRLKDSRRTIRVAIVDDVRPHRTARVAISEMI